MRLRPIQDDDTENIVQWRNSQAVQSQFIFRDILTAEMHMNWLYSKVYTGSVIQYIIEIGMESFIPVGSIYIRDIDTQNESGELGIFIGEADYRSKGYGTLAIKTFVPYCFSLGIHRIFLKVLSSNYVAQSSYIKSGFIKEGEAKDMLYIDGKRLNVTFMSIINN